MPSDLFLAAPYTHTPERAVPSVLSWTTPAPARLGSPAQLTAHGSQLNVHLEHWCRDGKRCWPRCPSRDSSRKRAVAASTYSGSAKPLLRSSSCAGTSSAPSRVIPDHVSQTSAVTCTCTARCFSGHYPDTNTIHNPKMWSFAGFCFCRLARASKAEGGGALLGMLLVNSSPLVGNKKICASRACVHHRPCPWRLPRRNLVPRRRLPPRPPH
jgi:hypothetical protein